MEENKKHGALVSLCHVLQEEVPLDPAGGTRRYYRSPWGLPVGIFGSLGSHPAPVGGEGLALDTSRNECIGTGSL